MRDGHAGGNGGLEHRRRTRGVVGAVVVVVSMLLFVGFASVGVAVGSGSVSVSSNTGGPSGGSWWRSLVIPDAEVFDGGALVAAAELSRRESPEAFVAREVSSTAFRRLNAAAAARVARESFPGVVVQSGGGPPVLPRGQRIVRFLGADAAQLALPGGRRAIVESLQPMAHRVGHSGFAPIDLALHADGSGYRPLNSATSVQIPTRLSAGVQIPGSGMSLTPVGVHGAPLSGSQGILDGASVVYANTQVDADTLVKPTVSGFRVDALLRSSDSPETLDYKVGVPRGSRLVMDRGSGIVNVIDTGRTVASVVSPSALDSEGTVVPVSMSVHGSTVSVRVDRNGGSYRYPIEVDPELKVEDPEVGPSSTNSGNWEWHAEPAGDFKQVVGTGYLETQGAGEYAEKNWAAWGYETKGDSKIFEVKIKEGPVNNKEDHVESYLELEYAEGGKGVEYGKPLKESLTELYNEFHEAPEFASVCPENAKKEQECVPGAGHEKNAVVFEQAATAAAKGHYKFEDRLDEGTVVSISEPSGQHATAEFNKSTAEYHVEVEKEGKHVLEWRKNVLDPASGGVWLSKSLGALGLISKDTGIGVDDTKLEYESSPSKWELISGCSEHNYRKGTSCHEEKNCQGVQCYPSHEESWLLESKLPNGEDKIRYRAEEAMEGSESPGSEDEVKVKVDTAKPHGLYLEGLPYGNELSEGKEYPLTAYATDGEGSTVASSGIKELKLYIENREITRTAGTAECSASAGECTAIATYSLSGAELGAGHHQITIKAVDRAGNEALEYEPVTIRHSTPVALGPGSVDLQSGDFALSTTDVSIGPGLTVTRNYSSRDLTQGAEGGIGPQWSMSLGTSESLVEMPDKSMLMTDSSGAQTIFALVVPEAKPATYEAPVGDTNLKLTLEENKTTKQKLAYYLENSSLHTQDKFTLPSGDTKTWVPTIQEGALTGTTTASYSYEVLEPEAGKKLLVPHEEIAPHPGTSCSPLKAGCQALKFKYFTGTTTAKGESKSEWGNYKDHLEKIYLLTYNPVSKEMTKEPGIAVAEYTYDAHGRLRAEWNPSVKPGPPTTTYGYDEEGHVTAMTPPERESWVFAYGTAANDAGTGRLMRATQAPASAGLWGGELAKYSVAPKITGTPVVGGSALTASTGTWTTGVNAPVSYAYQWDDCNSSGLECVAIPGATNSSYVPHVTDAGHTLVVQVSALNGGGAAVASSPKTSLISTAVSSEYGIPKRTPVTDIIPGPSSNLWYTSSSTNEIGEMTTAGVVLKDFALPSGSEPHGLTVGSDGNVWFADTGTSKIGKITTAGVITEYSLPSGSRPVGVAEGADKNVWFTEPGTNNVAKITTSGTITPYSTASGSEPYEIAAGPSTESSLWFTERANGKVAKVTTAGTVTEYSAIENAESRPANITLGPDNYMWVSVKGLGPFPQYQQIFKVNPSTGAHSHVLTTDGIVGGITTGSDKNLWYTERETNEEGYENEKEFVNRLTTAGVVTTHKLGEGERLGGIASGSDGNLWVGSESPMMAKVTTSGTATYYSLNWSTAEHITTGPDGNLWYTDAESSRVGKITTAGVVTEYQLPFGSEPEGITSGPDGKLWFTERKTNKIGKITTAGVITEYTDPTSGAEPDNIVAGPDGNLWFTESKFFNGGKTGIAKITTSGTVTEYGLPEKGGPKGIAVGSEGKIWFTEYDSGYVGSINTSGGELKEYSLGSTGPEAIVTGPDGDMWVPEVKTEQIARVSPTGSVTQFSVSSQPCGITVGPEKSIWFKASSKIGKITVSGAVTEYPALGGCRSITFGPDGNLWLGGSSSIGKVIMNPTVSPPAGLSGLTMEYGVPLEGTGAPAQMGTNSSTHMREPAKWGQREEEDPVEATSIIPPDSPQGWPAASYSRATTYYLDSQGRLVNVAAPSKATYGSVSTTEYNELNDVVRTLTPGNRERALAAGCESEEKCQSAVESKLLDTENTYNGEGAKEGEVLEPGTQLIESLGPEHMVKYTKGEKQYEPGEKASEAMGRSYTHNYYNEGAPSENPRTHRKESYDLLTMSESFVELPAGEKERTDVKTTVKSYSGQEDLGWLLREPTSVTVNPGSLKLTTTTVYEENAAKESNGDVVETRSAGSANTYTYASKFGEAGTEPGKLKGPFGVAVDSKGNIWTADESNNRIEEFGPEGKYLTSFGKAGTESGEFKEAKGVTIEQSSGDIWVADAGNNRVQKFGPEGKWLLTVGKAGTGNGELKSPKAVAIDKSGDIWVADSSNNRIEEFGPEGKYLSVFGKAGTGNGELKEPKGIAIDAKGNIWVVDTANNRIQEFEPNGKPLAHFGSLGTGAGQFKTPYNIAIDAKGNLWIADEGNNRLQELSSSGAFIDQVGWTGKEAGELNGPRAVAIAAGGEVWTSDYSNNRLEEFSAGPNARDQRIVYYSSAENTEEKFKSCGKHPEWEGLPCETVPTKQSELAALPKLPETITKAYNIYDEPETIEEVFTSAAGVKTTRTKTNTYDEAGRLVTSETKSTNPTEDKPLPVLTDTYSSTGQLETQSAEVKGEVKTITTKYNSLGQATEYVDADGAKTTAKYAGPEGDYLLEEVADGSAEGAGRQTYSYDETTKLMTKLTSLGKEGSEEMSFTASYNVEGQLQSEVYPNGMCANYAYNQVGEATRLEYIKTTNCAEEKPTVWYYDERAPSIRGEMMSQTSSLASETYGYDQAGRLTEVMETPTGEGCTTRLYAYDEASDRVSLSTAKPTAEGLCTHEGATVQAHNYDEAGRLTDEGITYDPLGDVTSLPEADAEKHVLTTSFYVTGAVAAQEQNGVKHEYELDPLGRVLQTTTGTTRTINHYDGGGETPAWTCTAATGTENCETGKWTRNIPGIGGSLVAVQTSGSAPVLQLHDLDGDVIATAALSPAETKLLGTYNSTEFGVPNKEKEPPSFAWLGAEGVSKSLSSGVITYGATSYIPQTGLALQTEGVEPIGEGGSGGGEPYHSRIEPWVWQGAAASAAEAPGKEAAREYEAFLKACEQNPVPGCPNYEPPLPVGTPSPADGEGLTVVGQSSQPITDGYGEPVAIESVPCRNGEDPYAYACNSKGEPLIRAFGHVSSPAQILKRAKNQYRKDMAVFESIKGAISTLLKGAKEAQVQFGEIVNGVKVIVTEVFEIYDDIGIPPP